MTINEETVTLAKTVLDGLATEGYAIEQLEDDARSLAEAVIRENTST